MKTILDFIAHDLGDGKQLHNRLQSYARQKRVQDPEGLVSDFYVALIEENINFDNYNLKEEEETQRKSNLLMGAFRNFVTNYFRKTLGRKNNRTREVCITDINSSEERKLEDILFTKARDEELENLSTPEWQEELRNGLNEHQYKLALDYIETTRIFTSLNKPNHRTIKEIKRLAHAQNKRFFQGLSDNGLKYYLEKLYSQRSITRTQLSKKNDYFYHELCGRKELFDQLVEKAKNPRNQKSSQYSDLPESEIHKRFNEKYRGEKPTKTKIKQDDFALFRELKKRNLLEKLTSENNVNHS